MGIDNALLREDDGIMPRNIAKPVDEVTRRRTINYAHALADIGEPVTLHYVKRNGQDSSHTGKVVQFAGKVGFDTFSVILSGEDRPRTINLCRLKSMSKPVE